MVKRIAVALLVMVVMVALAWIADPAYAQGDPTPTPTPESFMRIVPVDGQNFVVTYEITAGDFFVGITMIIQVMLTALLLLSFVVRRRYQ